MAEIFMNTEEVQIFLVLSVFTDNLFVLLPV